MYALLRQLIYLFPPETAHEAVIGLGATLSGTPIASILERFYHFEDPLLQTSVFGIDFQNPVGLAAGFDKNGRLMHFLPSFGFGFIEVGTVTPKPQAGNPKPRIFRLSQDTALINRLGFNNEGTDSCFERLRVRPPNAVVGVNIGKNKITPNNEAIQDYEQCFLALSDFADYVVVNVSSPNTPNLRELQDKEPLRALLAKMQELNSKKAKRKPVLLKIAPDLTEGQLDDVLEIVRRTAIDGVIATNTTVSRDGIETPRETIEKIGAGGLSGKPLRERSTATIRHLYKKSGGGIPIIGVGGIFSGNDAYEKIRAGASLVQVYTGLIYEGPGLVKKIKRELCLTKKYKDELKRKNVRFEESRNIADIARDIDVLYVTRIQKERFASHKEYLQLKGSYVVDRHILKRMKKKSIILHPLPRVDEINHEIDDDRRAAYFRQAKNGLYVRMAILEMLLK